MSELHVLVETPMGLAFAFESGTCFDGAEVRACGKQEGSWLAGDGINCMEVLCVAASFAIALARVDRFARVRGV